MAESHSEGIQSTPGHGSHGIQTEHDDGHALAPLPFTDAEIERFHAEDRYAGGAIVVLMTSIFSMGVILYSIVLASVL